LRLLNVLALTYLFVYFVRSEAGFFRNRIATAFVWCGQHSLVIYSVGVFLSCAAYIAITETAGSMAVCAAMNIVGSAILLGLAFALHKSAAKKSPQPDRTAGVKTRVAQRWALLRP
jgi:hypothetical protein